ncbi:DUF2125 domain-containing protein [Roseibacterium sp. SDUM158017]|uniref:DUF2125 domain-containing protein n=1 Tax=Roseicyclus salinarum TaxID=3036773 RepID=UPI0024157773|nr:DUF2125 domain-containing protein [Roseibacterium sp. SDUM158017]MDG4646820.1 DUF2125 domain-containing protein [Roseibacterium sp. SDUM158017]
MPRLSSCISALALTLASPALAQVSAEDIWSEWQAASDATGQEMTADVTQTEDGLVLSNLTTRMEQDGTTSIGRVERVTLTELDDGTLSVEIADPYTLEVTFPTETGGGEATIEFLLSFEELDIVVSGTADARSYAYSADVLRIVNGAISGPQPGRAPEMDLEIVMRDLATTYDLFGTPGDAQRFESDGTVGSLAARLDLAPPPVEDGRLKLAFSIGGMSSTSSGTIVALATLPQSAKGLPEDFEVAGSVSYDWTRFDVSFDSPADSFAAAYSNEGGEFGIELSNEALAYDISATGIEARVSGSEIPVAVAVSAASSELSLSLPLAASPELSEASVRLDYRDLEAGDEAWAMIDPTGSVPRDPLTVILDARAQVLIMRDMMDPAFAEAPTPPGEVRSLTVSELELRFGDTSLTGLADLSFAAGQAVPQPVGDAFLRLEGGNALLDRLQAAGVIGPEQAGMARGMVGMFARPGATPDTLETTIEFGEGGSITANGIPLR